MKHLSIAMLVLVACAARTDLGGKKISGGGSVCVPPPPSAHCSGWTMQSVGIVGPPPPANEPGEVASVIRTGCDALVAWARWDANGAAPSVWSTMAIDFGGLAAAEPILHPGISATISGTPALWLAQNGSRVGALESDETGCRFLALDAQGNETASVVSLGSTGCAALAADGQDFSFLRAPPDGVTPVTIETVAGGNPTTLALPAGQVFWDRLAFDDQSFLVYTFIEDIAHSTYDDWLAPFDATGNAIAPQQTMNDVDTAPVTLVPTKTGVLGGWIWGKTKVRPLDRHGAPTGPDVNVTGDATVYETLLLPTPDGDVLYAWSQLDDDASFSLHAIALGPDGTPRGPATTLDTNLEDARPFGAVESSGARALLVRMTSTGLEARSLACTP